MIASGTDVMLTSTKPVIHESKIREFAADTAAYFVSAVFRNLEGTRTGDPDALHDMRVATRRLRETVNLFQQFYSPVRFTKTAATIKKMTRLLGLPREMDVNLERLRAFSPEGGLVVQTSYEHLLASFEQQQSNLKNKMLKAFDKLDLQSVESAWRDFAQSAVPDGSRIHILFAEHQAAELEDYTKQMPGLLWDKARPVLSFEATEQTLGNDALLHALRIATKKLRYAFEILKPLLETGPGEPPIGECKRLQDILGDLHDRVALINHLREHQTRLSQRNLLLLGHGVSRIANELQAAKRTLIPEIAPAHQELIRALPGYLLSGFLQPDSLPQAATQ